MAGESTYSLVREFLPEIWEGALEYVKYNFVMPSLVKVFTDSASMVDRKVTEREQGTVDEDLGELEDMTAQQITRSLLATLTPAEHGMQHFITDRRVSSDDVDILADAAMDIGYQIGKHVETKLLTDLASLRGGSVGTAGNALAWSDIFNGRARLAAAGVPGPYSVVLHEYQWLDLATAANIAAAGVAHSMQIRDEIQSRYYLGSMSDMNFFVSGLVPIDGNDDATGGIFSRDALALDLRRALRIEPERDASRRGTELNATIIYAHGLWRPTWGVKVVSDATAPGSAVTVNVDLSILGTVDDATPAAGQDSVFTFIVANVGSNIANDVEVTFTIPANFTYLSDDSSQGSYNSSTKKWAVGALAAGEVARITLTLDATSAGASLDVVGEITASTPSDNVAGNDSATVTVTIS